MAGMLSAIPKTPLYSRLEAEGRLDNAAADDPRIATNVIPLRMTREELRDGWVDLMDRLYDAENYFERFDALFVEGKLPLASAKVDWLRRNRPLAYLKHPGADDPGGPGDAGEDLVRPADPPLSPGLRPLPPQAADLGPAAALPLPVRLEVHPAHPLRHA